MRDRLMRLTWPGLTLFVFLLAWEAATRGGLIAPYMLPAPSTIAMRLAASWTILVPHIWVTTIEIVLGFLLAVVVGVALAIATAYLPVFERSVYPWIVASQAVPKVAIGPLFVLWMGFGLLPKVVIAFLIAFFPVMIDTVVGLRSIEPDSVLLLRSMGARRWKTFFYLNLPSALPNIFGGMKVAITLATIGAIVGEFIGANEGLGYVLIVATGNLDAPLVFAVLVLISALAVIFYAVVELIEEFFIWWHVSKRRQSGSPRFAERRQSHDPNNALAPAEDAVRVEIATEAHKLGRSR
jgi:NitT/TauT family transport system permease protein